MRVDATSYEDAADRICSWAQSGASAFVSVASVNNVMEARDDPGFLGVMNRSDLVTPDGMPLVWALRLLGVRGATRVYGPDLTPVLCDRAAALGIPVAFYGGTPDVLRDLRANLAARHPGLRVVYSWPPPFRPLTEEEDREVTSEIAASGARIVFVGLGTPKQELWMNDHLGAFPAVMVGVGAAFDFLAGHKVQAPQWMQRSGTEWAFRLATEPRRLWKRYLVRNPRFIALFAHQLMTAGGRAGGNGASPPRSETGGGSIDD
jgi:N-acetylglucosaminyldiphosphoundecaprenol N-acetyl-beta-D-mannosaminyltransferase